jgi:16S rRNA (adenine1518-N6/adenine1519-N6)-dimethyltransferase
MNPRELLEQHPLLPKKSLGQNFLHDPNVVEKIVASAKLTTDDIVLEIGTGTGTLTEVLAREAKRVITVEMDERLRPILETRLAPYSNVEVIYQDILTTDVPALIAGSEYVVVANVPYYISSYPPPLLETHQFTDLSSPCS